MSTSRASSYATWQGDGPTRSTLTVGSDDIVALKLTSAGAYQWHTFYGSSNSDYSYGIAVACFSHPAIWYEKASKTPNLILLLGYWMPLDALNRRFQA
jgi:hypothetical protein